MIQPGRKYTALDSYRYGFNGKENDNEVVTGAIAFEARIYDSRIGKFLSVDPLISKNPGQSPYAYNRNSPISILDWLGLGDKFFNENGKLLHESKGKGTGLYVVSSEQFTFIKSKYKDDMQLTEELSKIGIKAYASQDEAAQAWAPGGYEATDSDPEHLERAARIFQTKALGDAIVKNLYVLGNTVTGEKKDAAKSDGVTGQVDPYKSTINLSGKDILSYSHTVEEILDEGITHNVPGYSDPSQNNNWKIEMIKVTYTWTVSGMIHTHPPNSQSGKFSITSEGRSYHYPYGGDIAFAAVDGYTLYLVPTSWDLYRRMFRLDPADVNDINYWPSFSKAQEYMREKQKTLKW